MYRTDINIIYRDVYEDHEEYTIYKGAVCIGTFLPDEPIVQKYLNDPTFRKGVCDWRE